MAPKTNGTPKRTKSKATSREPAATTVEQIAAQLLANAELTVEQLFADAEAEAAALPPPPRPAGPSDDEYERACRVISSAVLADPSRLVAATSHVLSLWRLGRLSEDEIPVARILLATWFAYADDDRRWLKEIATKSKTLLEAHAGEHRLRMSPRAPATGPSLNLISGRGGDLVRDRDDDLRALRSYAIRVLADDWLRDNWSDEANESIARSVATWISTTGFAIDGTTIANPRDPAFRRACRDEVAGARKHARNDEETRSRERIAEDVVRAVLRAVLRAAGRSTAEAAAKAKNVFANLNKDKKRTRVG